jgi:hypothetical protein
MHAKPRLLLALLFWAIGIAFAVGGSSILYFQTGFERWYNICYLLLGAIAFIATTAFLFSSPLQHPVPREVRHPAGNGGAVARGFASRDMRSARGSQLRTR